MKLKVLQIIGDATLAGAPRHLLSLLENIELKKFSLFLICPPGPLAGEVRNLKRTIDIEIVPMRSKIDLGAIKEIRSNIKHIKPDVIHIHGTRAGILARLSVIGLKYPVIYTEHLWTKDYQLRSRFSHHLQLIGLWFLDMFTTLTIAVSQAVKDFLIESQITRPEKVLVIYNGTEPPKKKAKPFEGKNTLIASIGTLNEQKGMQYLIQAMPKVLREFPDSELVIIGQGPYKTELEKLIKNMKLASKVKLTGFVKDVYDELEKVDIYVQPSISESFGLAILQAMSMGLPVVATNTGGIPEVVTSDKTGILVESKDPESLADGLIDFLRDPKKAQKMGTLGAEDAKIKFNLEDMIIDLETVYVNMAETRSKS